MTFGCCFLLYSTLPNATTLLIFIFFLIDTMAELLRPILNHCWDRTTLSLKKNKITLIISVLSTAKFTLATLIGSIIHSILHVTYQNHPKSNGHSQYLMDYDGISWNTSTQETSLTTSRTSMTMHTTTMNRGCVDGISF